MESEKYELQCKVQMDFFYRREDERKCDTSFQITKKCGINWSSCPWWVKQELTGWDCSLGNSDKAQEKPFLSVRIVMH